MHAASLRHLLLVFALASASAEETKPAAAFVKGKSATKAEAGPFLPRHLLLTFETYALPQGDLDALHGDGLAAKPFYERVRQFVAEGKATLETVVALPTKSGNRAIIESVDEVLYPTEFDPAEPGRPFALPVAYEMRPTGARIEVDPVLHDDETEVDMNLAPDFCRLVGFRECKADPNQGGEIQPIFATRKVATSITCRLGVPTLLGTLSAPHATGLADAEGDGKVSVTFALARMSAPAEVGPPQAAESDATKAGNLRMVFRFYSMPRDKARDFLATTTDADKLHDLVRAMAPADWKQERLITLHTRTGQRAAIEEVVENIYGTGVEPSVSHASAKQLLPASFSAFEMRPLGWRIEVDPVLGEDGRYADLNLAPEHTEFRGYVQGHPLLERYPQQSVFASQKITTAVTALLGHQCFLGTFNAPGDTGVNGRKDDGRAWFTFVKVTLE
ncbi:MAG: hypothetical protein ACOYMN_10760 [Roseimicrobium sp.]